MALRKKDIQNRLEYIAFRALISFLRSIPYHSAKLLAVSLFNLVGYHLGVRRKVASKQLAKVYPHKTKTEIKKILKSMYRNMALSALESYVLSEENLRACVSVKDPEHVTRALNMGKGAILITGHFGNWEAARVLPHKAIPVAVVAKKQRNRLFNDYTDKVRKQSGANLIDMKTALRGIMAYLKENQMVAILTDQNAGKRGVITDFLGFPASHWTGAAKIALKYKIPIVPGFALRKDDDHLCICFEPIIYHPEWQDNDENCLALIKEINEVLYKYIHAYPEQWFWVHKRWKGATDMFDCSV